MARKKVNHGKTYTEEFKKTIRLLAYGKSYSKRLLGRVIRGATGVSVCNTTAWNYLNGVMPRLRAIQRPLQIRDDRQLRLKYCLSVKRQVFDRLVFVDEKVVHFGGPNANRYVRVYHPDDPLRFEAHRGQSVLKLHFVGAMSRDGGKLLHFFPRPESVTSYDVNEFLVRLRPLMKSEDVLLMDNCPIHKEVLVQRTIATMPHLKFYPPRSPELNAIEYVWSHMENIIQYSPGVPGLPTKDAGMRIIRRAWEVASHAPRCSRHAERVWLNMQTVAAKKGDNRYIETPFRIPSHYRPPRD